MNNDLLIKVDSVSKKFCKDLRTSLKYGVFDVASEILGQKHNNKLRDKEFWAVQDVSFEVRRGECLGLIGRNGAGKSTLLKMLNGLIKPDSGKIEMHGKVGALIELGAGFNPILTGRENVYVNGQLLGFSNKEVNKKFDAILDFAEIGDFIDSPVQNYSSGMKARLGFAIATQMEPDVLIIDEVLAVGDSGFKMKSINRMYELLNSSAVIFVNHSMASISRICNKILFLNNGTIEYSGNDILFGIEKYLGIFEKEKMHIEYNKECQIQNAGISSGSIRGFINDIPIIYYLDDLIIEIEYTLDESITTHQITLGISNKDLQMVAAFKSEIIVNNRIKSNHARITIPQIELTNGNYSITYYVHSCSSGKREQFYATYRHYSHFNVQGLSTLMMIPFLLKGNIESY